MHATGHLFRPLDTGAHNGPPSTSAGAHSPASSLTADLVYDTDAPAAVPTPRVLTKPCEPVVPGGYDNINDNLIVSVGDAFVSSLGTRYVVEDLLGQGTFGQVFRCVGDDGDTVAVKVIKNQAAYYHQARVEIGILQFLNTRADPDDSSHIVRLRDFFLHKNHLCLVFELLNLNLFELVRHNKFRGLSLSLVRVFIGQVLQALVTLHTAAIIHCDIKPENILLTDATSGEVKLIDFGSACFANRTVYTYIQSRFYRAPEVVLGHPYTQAVDMWSLGCVAAELFLGLPLFPAASELDLLARVTETVSPLPSGLLAGAKNSDKFYTPGLSTPGLRLRTPEEFLEANGVKAPRGKQYFQHRALADIINAYPFKPGLDEGELLRERANREAFTDFLLGLLDVDPHTRWTPRQAQTHPFITGDLFSGPFQPSSDPTAVVSRPLAVAIPMPRQRAQTAPALDGLTAALLASSPQMHAQAHAAAMAAVQMQMNLQQQQGRSIPVTSAAAAAVAAAAASPYVAAHSLQRIMDPAMASMLGRTPSEGSELAWGRPGAPPLSSSMFSPPSRSFGVHLAPTAPELPPPSFDPRQHSSHRIVPLTHLPAGSEPLDTSPVAFQPSSVATYRSTLAAAGAAGMSGPTVRLSGDRKLAGGSSGASAQQTWPATVAVGGGDGAAEPGPRSSGGGSTPQRKPSSTPRVGEDAAGEDPADWDPLWSDDLLAEEERSPGAASARPQSSQPPAQQRQQPAVPDTGLSLAMAHLTQLQHLAPTAPTGHQAASWPVGRAASPSALPQGAAGTGEAMMWSPPRVPLVKAPVEPAATHGPSHQEPLQRLQGFVVPAEEGGGAEKKKDDSD